MPGRARLGRFVFSSCLVSGALAFGCSSARDDGGAASSASGLSAAADSADRACDVVLRTVARPAAPTGGGLLTNCVAGGCFFVWKGTLDVSASAVAAGAKPSVTFRTTSSDPTTWYTVDATPIGGGEGGAQRYAFTIDDHTVPDGMSLTSLQRTVIEVEPFVTMPDGSRHFDHNRNAGAIANYVLDASNSWSIAEDASVCAPPANATLRFLNGWQQVEEAAVVAGGHVTVEYELARLNECMSSTYQGEPAWGTSGFARFAPSGVTVTGPLTKYAVTSTGVPYVDRAPWTFDVPKDATGVELWFETSGETCSPYWDSNLGRNYAYAVASAPTSSRATWAGNWEWRVSRGCMDQDFQGGVREPLTLDSWAITRATCIDVDVEVWIPGVSDVASGKPELVLAQVEYQRDGGELQTAWLDYVGRSGNNLRYRWNVSNAGLDFVYTPWDSFSYALRFSTNGNDWFRVAQADGPDGGAPHTLARGADWCPSIWGAKCAPPSPTK